MTNIIQKIAVIGMGKVGALVGTLLHETAFAVTGYDATAKSGLPFATKALDVMNAKALQAELGAVQAVVSCLPYHLNIHVARAAHAAGVHYFDLTEDVPTTREIMEMAKTSKGVMAPQCGLAPGFIGIAGASTARGFDDLRAIHLRVGALPQHPSGQLSYAFNWSAEGVVNEYLNDCEVIQDGQIKQVPAMQAIEKIVINGLTLEAFTTSGGLGTMCETFKGKVAELNYKTIRYPGHCELMKFFFHELLMREDRALAGTILVNAKPPVSEDVVYVYVAVEGHKDGHLQREEFVQAYPPKMIAGQRWRAISWTTAASICAVVEMVAGGVLPAKGFIRQEDIALEAFLATKNGGLYV
jgi:saccharopine dehydrogenase-like NADP-dependent oxidoreductase